MYSNIFFGVFTFVVNPIKRLKLQDRVYMLGILKTKAFPTLSVLRSGSQGPVGQQRGEWLIT
jgi:hypothetical protein